MRGGDGHAHGGGGIRNPQQLLISGVGGSSCLLQSCGLSGFSARGGGYGEGGACLLQRGLGFREESCYLSAVCLSSSFPSVASL